MNSKYKKLLSDTGLFALGSFGSKFVLFFLVPLYTNVLTTSEYGMADIITTSTSMIIPFLTLSINDALLRFCLDKNEDKHKVIWQVIYILIFSTIVLFVISPIIYQTGIFGEYTFFFIVLTAVQSFRSSLSLYLKCINKVNQYAIDSILYTIVLCLLNIVFLLGFKLGLRGYLSAQIISVFISNLFILLWARPIRFSERKILDKKLLKSMINYSLPLIANAVSWWIINSSDRYMIKFIISDSAVGLYSVAAKMPSLLTSITYVFYQAWLISSITEYENGKDKKFYSNVFRLYLVVLSFGASMMLCIIRPFMKVYVGQSFNESWQYVPMLLLAAIFSTFANYFMAFYKSEKKNYREVLATSIGAIINIALNLLLLRTMGIQGACLATLFSEAVMAIFVLFDTRSFFSFDINFRKLFLSVSILLFQGIMLIIINNNYSIYVSIVCLMVIAFIFKDDLSFIIQKIKGSMIKRKSK